MAIVFALRGTQLNAYYARFADTAGLLSSGATGGDPVVTASGGAGIFGGSYINKANGTGLMRALNYPGYSNTPSTTAFTVLMRIIPRWASGAPTIQQTLFAIGGYSGSGTNKIECSLLTSGALRFRQTNDNNSNATLNDTSATYSGWTINTPADLMVSWDGTTSANAFKWSIDGVAIGTMTISSAFTVKTGIRSCIVVGAGVDSNHSNFDVNEMVIYDTAENHVYATRSGFISVANTIGYPVASVVQTGVTLPVTGSYTDSVGTYDGSDRWTDPGQSLVNLGTTYKANSTSLNKTGTLQPLTSILDATDGVETGYTVRQALRLMLSALAGKLSGAPGSPIIIRDVNDTKDRITATVDANGNRTAVTKDVS